jgi:hypothetical protein
MEHGAHSSSMPEGIRSSDGPRIAKSITNKRLMNKGPMVRHGEPRIASINIQTKNNDSVNFLHAGY